MKLTHSKCKQFHIKFQKTDGRILNRCVYIFMYIFVIIQKFISAYSWVCFSKLMIVMYTHSMPSNFCFLNFKENWAKYSKILIDICESKFYPKFTHFYPRKHPFVRICWSLHLYLLETDFEEKSASILWKNSNNLHTYSCTQLYTAEKI